MFRTILATTIALVAIAAPASASPHTLNIESAPTTTFNTPTLFYVYGTDAPPSDLGGDFWIEIVDLPGEIVPACPFGHQDALGFAENLPGQILDISLQPDRAVGGDFSNPIIFRPLMPHRNLICAYTHDGAGTTLARAAAVIDVQPLPTANPTPQPTANPTPQPTRAADRQPHAPADRPRPRPRRQAGQHRATDPDQGRAHRDVRQGHVGRRPESRVRVAGRRSPRAGRREAHAQRRTPARAPCALCGHRFERRRPRPRSAARSRCNERSGFRVCAESPDPDVRLFRVVVNADTRSAPGIDEGSNNESHDCDRCCPP